MPTLAGLLAIFNSPVRVRRLSALSSAEETPRPPSEAAHAWNIDVSPVAAPGGTIAAGSLIIFQGKFATVVVNAPAIFAAALFMALISLLRSRICADA